MEQTFVVCGLVLVVHTVDHLLGQRNLDLILNPAVGRRVEVDFLLEQVLLLVVELIRTEQLDMEQTKQKLLSLRYIRDELASWEARA